MGMTAKGLGRDAKYLLNILLTAALKCVTIKWLGPDTSHPPHIIYGVRKYAAFIRWNNFIYSLRLQKAILSKHWKLVMHN